MRFDGSDDIPFKLTAREQTVIMAKFAVGRTIFPERDPSALIKIARGEISGGFTYNLRKLWSGRYDNYNGLAEGDVELVADELGVYEIVFPFDADQMETEARHVARQFSGVS